MDFEDDDELQKESQNLRQIREFDCPGCNANNPVEDTLREGDEVLCNYCGSEYRVRFSSDGRLRLKEM